VPAVVYAQPAPERTKANFADWTTTELVLSNGIVKRRLRFPTAAKPYLTTTDYRPAGTPSRYFTGNETGKMEDLAGARIAELESEEYSFTANGKAYNAKSGWTVERIDKASDANGGNGAAATLRCADGTMEVELRYLLYPDSPVVRKRLTVRNLSSVDVAIENVEIEKFNFENYWPGTFSWVYSDYGRRKSLVPFTGNSQDALVALHNPDWRQGIVIGNEASGINKYTAAFVGGANFKAGLAPASASIPCRHWLKPGEAFVAPQIFTIVYANARFEDVLNTAVPDFVRKHMGIRLSQFPDMPTFIFNTWEPFAKDINEKLVMELATAAAAAGVKQFAIDDGWQDSYGDWGIDRVKFPNGLKPVMDHIKALGMRAGLWVSIGTADPKSKVYAQHPEWFVKDRKGKPYSIVIESQKDKYTACFSTGWRDHIKETLLRLKREYGVEYFKLDFSVVNSPYRFDPADSGCYATDHPGHRDHASSLSANFDVMWQVFDEVKARHPDVFIDCSFETMGGLQLIDYALLQHADANWLSNYGQLDEVNDLRIRNMAWWRSPAMPATSLIIGNSKLADKGFELHLKSLAGALPIILGDPRRMTARDLARCRKYADFFTAMQARHNVFAFRQDLAGFGEPAQGSWDGFQRVNTDSKSGGLVGVFRHGAAEQDRQVTINYLAPERLYEVREFDGASIIRASGRALATSGFEVTLPSFYDGRLLEVRLSQ